MGFNRYNLLLLFRVALLLTGVALLFFLWNKGNLWLTFSSLVIVCIIQIYELLWFINRANRELSRLLNSVRHKDYSISFVNPKLGKPFSTFYKELNEIVLDLKDAKLEKESQFELFKQMLEKISIGIIALDEKKQIVLINLTARESLNIPPHTNFERFSQRRPHFAKAILEIKEFGGRRLVSLFENGVSKEFSVELTPLKIQGKVHSLVSFQNIKDEIEQKEIDAWHNLIRILTHEIMNSITPLSSLTETMQTILKKENGELVKPEELDQESIEDLLVALSTIHKRSKGMLEFVEDYRRLTKIPAPHFELINVTELFQDVHQLLKSELEAKGIQFTYEVPNKRLAIKADKKLIEQVLINLITNAMIAMADTKSPTIQCKTSISTENISLHITDNGRGIEEDKLSRIFIPFYSTKENGTGIGLSLSKNIMRTHGGNIQVNSKVEVGTTFTLHFPNHQNFLG